MEKEQLKPTENDLSISNAQTREEYRNLNEQIPKNSSVQVRRTPLGASRLANQGGQTYAVKKTTKPTVSKEELMNHANLAEMSSQAKEEDLMDAVIKQSSLGYDEHRWKGKGRGYKSDQPAPSYLRCYKCQGQGHYPNQCPMPKKMDKPMRAPTGIPRSSFVKASATDPGAKLESPGVYVVTKLEKQAYLDPKKERPPFLPPLKKENEDDQEQVPDELCCPLCNELIQDARKTPCCSTTYCNNCITQKLLDSDDSLCPKCKKQLKPVEMLEDKIVKDEVIQFKYVFLLFRHFIIIQESK